MKQKLLKERGLRALLLSAVMLLLGSAFTPAWAQNVVDVLNQTWTGISGTSYAAFTDKKATSDAVYAGNCAGGNSSIQLRSNSSNSGIVTTTSGGKATKITVNWNSNTNNGRTLNVYGKNTAYSAAADLYNTSNQGTLIGTIVYGTSTELTISDDYEYIGFRSASGAMYLDEVQITWTPVVSSAVETTMTINVPAGFNKDIYTSTTGGTLTATVLDDEDVEIDGAVVTWSSSNEDVATVDEETGAVTLVSAGTTTITANYAGVADAYKASKATYELTVVDSTPASEVTEETIVFKELGYENAADVTTVEAKASTLVFEGSKYYDTGTGVRMYSGSTLTITSSKNKMSSIVFTFSDSSHGTLALGADEQGALSDLEGTQRTWTGQADEVTFTYNLTSLHNRIQSIAITYQVVSATQVETPEISVNDPEEPFLLTKTVTINCPTDGATIYYTTDGTEPTEETGTEYKDAFAIRETTTVKAIAVKSGMDDSFVASETFEKETVLNGLAALNQNENTSAQQFYVQLSGAQTSYVNGSYGFLQDADAATYIYGVAGLEVNKVYNGLFRISYQQYNKLPEITAITAVDGTISDAEASMEPEPVTLADLIANYDHYLCRMVRVEAATVTAALTNKNATIEQNGTQMALRQQGSEEITKLTEGAVVNLTVFPVLYNTTQQLYIFSDGLIEVDTRVSAELAFPEESYEADLSDDFTAPKLANTHGVNVVYFSSNFEVASVDPGTGEVTLAGAGTTTITARFRGDDTYLPGEASYTLTVTDAAAPSITVDRTDIQFGCVETSSQDDFQAVGYELTNFQSESMRLDVIFYTSADGIEEAGESDWLSVWEGPTDDKFLTSVTANYGEARTAYFRIAILSGTDTYVSDVITVTQAACDFATVPFEFNGGKGNLPAGLTHSGLGTDYSSAPKLKFDTTDDQLTLKLDRAYPMLALEFDIKGNGFSEGTFTVQASEDGENFTDLATYTELGTTQTERMMVDIDGNYTYYRWIYTEKVNGNVALGNIKMYQGYTRTDLTAGKWGTIFLNYDTDAGYVTGAAFYSVAGKTVDGEGNPQTLVLTEETGSLPAGPYFFQATEEALTVNFGLTPSGFCYEKNQNGLIGFSYERGVEEGNYLLKNNTIVQCGDGCSIAAFRAYIDMTEVPLYTGGAAGVKAFRIGGGEIDAVGSVAAGADNAPVFDLSGRRVSNAQKGLYITCGKKVVVK